MKPADSPLLARCALPQLAPGERGAVLAVHAPDGLHQRLNALGFRVGQPIQLIRRAPFKGPLQVRLGTTDVIIRGADAALIDVAR